MEHLVLEVQCLNLEIVQELRERGDKVLDGIQIVMVHVLWEDEDGWATTGITERLRV